MALKALVSKMVVMLLGIFTSVEQLVTDLPEAGTGILIRERSAHKPVEAEALQRSSFPKDMVFGVASSAYQYEGAVKEGGRGPCIWDILINIPGRTSDDTNGDMGNDQYHRYKEDVGLLKNLGVDAYRLSISWSRIFPGIKSCWWNVCEIPDGVGPVVNKEGVAYYNHLIDELIAKGVKPYVALWHWDLPQALQDDFGGWKSRDIVPAFAAYAEVCFKEFGDRVTHWVTLNEPGEFSVSNPYIKCGDPSDKCRLVSCGDLAYILAHNMILSHAAAARIYHNKYQALQGGSIGIALDTPWAEPLSDSPQDLEAAERLELFIVGWFLDPIFFGDYPEVMRTILGDRLPTLTKKESELVKGSADFAGINHYTSYYITDRPIGATSCDGNLYVDPMVFPVWVRDGVQIGAKTPIAWLYVVPWGIERLLNWLRVRYDNPPIVITENGMVDYNNASLTVDEVLDDQPRIDYHRSYLSHVLAAIKAGSNVKGYFAWSMLDNFEWMAGYSLRFGLIYVDHTNNFARIPKKSFSWFKSFLQPVENDDDANYYVRRGASLHQPLGSSINSFINQSQHSLPAKQH